MAGIRELKDRIASIRSARKITTAMQMVASSKLKKASKAVESFVPYQRMLGMILDDFLAYEQETDSPFVQKRKIKHVTIVAFSSGSGFCGAFNSTIINRLQREIDEWKKKDIVNFNIIGVGKKVSDALRKFDFKGTTEEWNRLVEHPDYEGSKELADHLMDNYKKKLTDKVVLIYFSYKNPMVHELRIVDYLPMEWEKTPHSPKSYLNFYIMEPDDHTLLRELLPKVLRSRIYAALLDSYSSEQGARTVAMQTASDNAGNLLDGLSIQLNRQRQQAITAEILDLSAAGEAENF